MSDADLGPGTPARGDPESLGIRAFEFIVADVDRIIQFMNITGLQPETFREAANAPDFLLGVLEYASKDDELLKLIHTELGIPPGTILAATWHQAPVPDSASGTVKKAERHPLPPRRSLFE